MPRAPTSVPAPDATAIVDFAPRLLDWFDQHGRKHLPWQQQRTPYRVWISEIMLQQTQVATVVPYYERFMQRFPNVGALAAAPLDEVLHLWTGLGYYARARNVHRAAQTIVREHAGVFPQEISAVEALPGIGRSTAGAILALALNQRHPILDGNVKRVLSRFFAIHGFPGELRIERALWRLADACTPPTRVADYTQAIMDLGATVCVRSRPLCAACPEQAACAAYRLGLQAQLPTPRPKKARPSRVAYAVIACEPHGAVLLEQRPATGVWGGLWTFPQFESRDAADEWAQMRFAGAPQLEAMTPYRHAFTHFDLTLHPLRLQVPAQRVEDGQRFIWYDVRSPARIGLAKPAVDLIRQLSEPVQLGMHAAET